MKIINSVGELTEHDVHRMLFRANPVYIRDIEHVLGIYRRCIVVQNLVNAMRTTGTCPRVWMAPTDLSGTIPITGLLEDVGEAVGIYGIDLYREIALMNVNVLRAFAVIAGAEYEETYPPARGVYTPFRKWPIQKLDGKITVLKVAKMVNSGQISRMTCRISPAGGPFIRDMYEYAKMIWERGNCSCHVVEVKSNRISVVDCAGSVYDFYLA